MSKPFDYIDNKKIDLNNQEHRDIVIQRNKKLQYHLENDIDLHNHFILKTKVIVRVSLNCLKCGTFIEEDEDNDVDDTLDFPNLKCGECDTKYHYSSRKSVYEISLKKLKAVKK